jgi:hypothetical protein
MPLFEMADESFQPIPERSFATMGIGERSDIQRLLRMQIEVLGDDLYVLTEEFGEWEDSKRRIDLLAIDSKARLVVIELKRTHDGGHMELQAIRYASMVAAMTFERAVAIHSAFLVRMGRRSDEARACLLKFLGWTEPDEEQFGSDVRIILASEGFSKELTTAVLWLRERDIDIRCIRLRPYVVGGKTLIDVEQVIPLPEAQDYMIRIREKEQEERKSRAERWSAESQQFCIDYWNGVLAELGPTGILEPDVKAMRKEDMRFKVGWPDFRLKAYFSRREPKSSVWLECRGENGIAYFEALQANAADIERAFGEPIRWSAEQSRGFLTRQLHGFDANDKSDWPRQHKMIADIITRLYRATKPFVEPLLGDHTHSPSDQEQDEKQ